MSEPTVPLKTKAKPFGIGLLLGALLGGIGAGYVWFEMRGQVHTAEAALEEASAAAATSEQAIQARLDQALALATLREARIALDRAQGELRRDNFGSASEQLAEAGTLMSRVDAGAAGLDREKLAKTTALVKAATIRVDDSSLAQDEQLASLERQVDGLIPQ